MYVIALADSCARSGLSVSNYINAVFLYDSCVHTGVCLCVICRLLSCLIVVFVLACLSVQCYTVIDLNDVDIRIYLPEKVNITLKCR